MAALTIRTARDVDVPAIEQVVRDAFARYEHRMDAVPAPVDADYATVVSALGARVALLDGAVAGVLVVWPHPDHLLVETLAVAPAVQDAGVGTRLLDVAEREAVELGVNAVRLATDVVMTESIAWYLRRGWVEIGRGLEQGYHRVFFEKRLA